MPIRTGNGFPDGISNFEFQISNLECEEPREPIAMEYRQFCDELGFLTAEKRGARGISPAKCAYAVIPLPQIHLPPRSGLATQIYFKAATRHRRS